MTVQMTLELIRIAEIDVKLHGNSHMQHGSERALEGFGIIVGRLERRECPCEPPRTFNGRVAESAAPQRKDLLCALCALFFLPAGPRYSPHFGGSMKEATAVAFLVACAYLPVQAFAQQPPSDLDLRAAYCIPIVNQQVAVYQNALSSPGRPLPPQLEQTIKNMAADAQDRANHLKRYLQPRMADLDATALLAAAEQGKQDLQRGEQDVIQCMTSCQNDANPAACTSSCSTDTLARVRRCTKLDWLP